MSDDNTPFLEAMMHPALATAMSLVKGVEYLRLLGDDPYRFIPLAVAPIGTVGEYVKGIGPGEWYSGPLVVVRPQGYGAPAPVQPVASPGQRFDDASLSAAIDRSLTTPAPGTVSAHLRAALHAAAAIALNNGIDIDTFQTCAAVAYGEMERR